MDRQEARKKAGGPDPLGREAGKKPRPGGGGRGEEGWMEGAAGTPRRHCLALTAVRVLSPPVPTSELASPPSGSQP